MMHDFLSFLFVLFSVALVWVAVSSDLEYPCTDCGAKSYERTL